MSGSAAVPTELVGAWARVSIRVGDGEPGEPQDVRYLQAGRAFVDLRRDRDGSGAICFAGTASWSAPRLRWHHELDREPAPFGAVDEGELAWLPDGRLCERGTFPGPGCEVPYEEVWRRLPGGTGGLLVLRCDDPPARLVRVGGHALAVVDARAAGGTFAARYDVRQAGRWTSSLTLGDTAAIPSPAELPTSPAGPGPAAGPGSRLTLGGLTWTVAEAASPPLV